MNNEYKIEAPINPVFLDHFKSQLLHLEIKNEEVKILYDGGGHQVIASALHIAKKETSI